MCVSLCAPLSLSLTNLQNIHTHNLRIDFIDITGLAIIGVVVSVVAGVVFFQRILQKHMHVLHKQGLAKDFIVKDLAADDGGLAAVEANHSTAGAGAGAGAEAGAKMDRNPLLGHPHSHSHAVPSAPSVYQPFQLEDGMLNNIDNSNRSSMPQPSAPELSLSQRRELADFCLL